MGLTMNSVGMNSIDGKFIYQRKSKNEKIIALAGNPNVGKSTIFNNLTGMHQHTGNWPGKTVTTAFGSYTYDNEMYTLVDLPGTYSLLSHSQEEEIARDYICFGDADAIVVVCDAVSLERNLNLVLQTIEITSNVIVCVNLLDEARKKNIRIDLNKLSQTLHVPVIGTTAREKNSLIALMELIKEVIDKDDPSYLRIANCDTINPLLPIVEYNKCIEECIEMITDYLELILPPGINNRWIALKVIDSDQVLLSSLSQFIDYDLTTDKRLANLQTSCLSLLSKNKIEPHKIKDSIVASILLKATTTAHSTIHFERADYDRRDRSLDMILTSKRTGFPIMFLLLLSALWLTITGANYPSDVLYKGLFWFGDQLRELLVQLHLAVWFQDLLINGIYRVLAWVVSVMLPPMAIFFPLFTLLEDLGYLPRVAFNLDHQFHKACACGKQALTMCMGFGCNAAGVIGCRIIDSPRERLIAILTNNFVPCNGRFPTLISLISMFFITGVVGFGNSFFSALGLTLIILLGIAMTLFTSRILSKTILKGIPSSFSLELPPYRKPQIGKVILRSIFDRTLFVLSRAIIIAVPAGLLIWILANVTVNDLSLLNYCTNFLDPFGRLIGLDGVILMAFLLGFPANEIVIPIIIMAYLSQGSIMDLNSVDELRELLVNNGWTWMTGLCTILFSLFHWPCSTTCLTIKKETGSMKWTLIAFALPTVIGIILCFSVANICRLFI